MKQYGIFKGRSRIRYGYSRFGWTRGNGTVWHGGIDVEALDDTTGLFPAWHSTNGTPRDISGKVIQSRIILDHSNRTWEWGHYVCVQLDQNQTPDAVNYLYFCHNAENLVHVGQRVKTGDPLFIMGNSGNAALADPPFKHCHFEVRATATGTGLDPTRYLGFPNYVGTYGSTEEEESTVAEKKLQMLFIQDPSAEIMQKAGELGLPYHAISGQLIGPASAGDAMTLWGMAEKADLRYFASETEAEK